MMQAMGTALPKRPEGRGYGLKSVRCFILPPGLESSRFALPGIFKRKDGPRDKVIHRHDCLLIEKKTTQD